MSAATYKLDFIDPRKAGHPGGIASFHADGVPGVMDGFRLNDNALRDHTFVMASTGGCMSYLASKTAVAGVIVPVGLLGAMMRRI